MKIQLIRLEEHDDIISARDKMGWGQTGRVVLIWPEKRRKSAEKGQPTSEIESSAAPPLARRLDLVLLQRRANELGVQLAFVTHHAEVRAHARSLGIPVFKTPRDAQNIHWRRSRRYRFPWHRGGFSQHRAHIRQQITASPHVHPQAARKQMPILVRGLIFTIAVLSVLMLMTALLPGAQVILVPSIETQSISFPVSARKGTTTINLSGDIPTYPTTTIVEGQATITSTESILVPDHFATGLVRFTNLTTETITIPFGTLVTAPLTDTIRFATTKESILPKGPSSSILVTVQAISPGSKSNLSAGSIRLVEGPLNYRLTAANTTPTRGGTERSAPAPSTDDRIRLYNQMVASLRQNALDDLEAQLAAGDILIKNTLVLDRQLVKTYEPDGNAPATHLRLTLRLLYRAEKIAAADLRLLGSKVLDATLPQNYQPIADTLGVTVNSLPETDRNQVAHFQITVQQKLEALISKEEALNLAIGLPPQEALQRLFQKLPLASEPKISIQPAWWPRLPFIPLRIEIITGNE